MVREAGPQDAERLARGFVDGLEMYRSFAPAGWEPPPFEEEVAHLRDLLADPGTLCLLADEDGRLAGQVMVLPASRAGNPVGEPGLAHMRNLFVAEEHWGTGLARDLHDAALDASRERGYTAMRLFVASGQERARRFYEREGWSAAGPPWFDPAPGLEIYEYRRPL